MRADLIKNLKERLLATWKDPVWSGVIAGVILAVFSSVGVALWHVISGLSYKTIFNSVVAFFNYKLHLPIYFFAPLVTLAVAFVVVKINSARKQSRHEPSISRTSPPKKEDLPFFHYGKDYHFFNARLSLAFPGWANEIRWYEGAEAVERLMILLSEPLSFRASKEAFDGRTLDYIETPHWWFRDTSSMHISKVQKVGKNKLLLNNMELVIDKIAVYKTGTYDFDFVYIETIPEKPTGAYEHSEEAMADFINRRGYFWEEYAMVGRTPITLQAYDDGAAEINGKIVRLDSNVRNRMRYLTKFNLIITFNSSPYNSTKFQQDSGPYFNGILQGTTSHKSLFEWLKGFDRWEGRKYY